MNDHHANWVKTVNKCIFQWMIDAMLAKGHNMTYSKFRVGGSAVQVIHSKKSI